MATATSKRSSDKARPVHEVRLGRIKAAIWENETQTGIRHNVTITRSTKTAMNGRQATVSVATTCR